MFLEGSKSDILTKESSFSSLQPEIVHFSLDEKFHCIIKLFYTNIVQGEWVK